MKVSRCYGCGRPRGKRSPVECPCWRSVNDGATIPSRIKAIRARVMRAHNALDKAQTDRERASASAVVRSVNRTLRGLEW